MKATLAILVMLGGTALPARAQSLGAPGCGPDGVQFDVETSSKQHPAPAPEPGKALVFFLQDDSQFLASPRPTTEFGIDGAWVGATHANSYFYVSVGPGEHHLCSNWESIVKKSVAPGHGTAALHFTAQAGESYYFVARDFDGLKDSPDAVMRVVLKRLDSDEGQLLTNSFAFSTSKPKS